MRGFLFLSQKCWLAIAITPFAALFTLPAEAACERLRIDGRHLFKQSNNIEGSMVLSESNGRVKGYANFYSPKHNKRIGGNVEGTFERGQLRLRIQWQYFEAAVGGFADDFYEIGIYEADVSETGEVKGTTFSFTRPAQRANWFLKGYLPCATITSQSPQSPAVSSGNGETPERPVRRLFRVTPPGEAPSPTNAEETEKAPVRRLGRIPSISPDTCKTGFVWRVAGPDDRVCVANYVRVRTRRENEQADSRRDPKGAYGPNTCISGFVWREAFRGDNVCVAPYVRTDTARDNELAPERRVQP